MDGSCKCEGRCQCKKGASKMVEVEPPTRAVMFKNPLNGTSYSLSFLTSKIARDYAGLFGHFVIYEDEATGQLVIHTGLMHDKGFDHLVAGQEYDRRVGGVERCEQPCAGECEEGVCAVGSA